MKIGYSRADALDKRIATLQVGNPFSLEVRRVLLLDDRRTAQYTERSLHRELEPLRMRGEWFRCTRQFMLALTSLPVNKFPRLMMDLIEAIDAHGLRHVYRGKLAERRMFGGMPAQDALKGVDASYITDNELELE